MHSMRFRYGLAVACLLLVPAFAAAQAVSSDADLARMIAEGKERSTTFATQNADLASRKVVVDVRWSLKIPERLNAALLDATRVSPNGTRYYFVVINQRRIQANAASGLIAPILAHELQHVFEALDGGEPVMVNGRVFETEAAQRVQACVTAEVSR